MTPNDLRQPGMISFEMNSQKVAVNLTHPVPMLFTARTGTPGLITGVLFVLAFLELCVLVWDFGFRGVTRCWIGRGSPYGDRIDSVEFNIFRNPQMFQSETARY